MRNIFILTALALLTSCGQGGGDKRAELERLKQQAEEVNSRIETLEEELAGSLNEDAVKRLPVEIKTVRPESFSSYFEVTGSLESINDAFISPETNGQVESVPVERGERVKKGDLLVKLNTDITEKNIAEVKTNLELASELFKKQKELWEKNIGSELQYLEAKNRKESLDARLATLNAQLDMSYIRAPFPGIIDDVFIKTGELASPGMRLMHLVNLEKMRLTARVSESFLASVHEGETVDMRVSSLPGENRKETVSRVGTVIDPSTRTFAVEVQLDNRDEKLRPNMLSSLRIKDYQNDSALVVPSIILKQDFKGTFLFLAEEGDKGTRAKKRYVKTGMTVEDRTMINSGIEPGDRIIVKGYNLVGEGSAIEIVNQ
jgi:RND family efflux transporter MFP subunit